MRSGPGDDTQIIRDRDENIHERQVRLERSMTLPKFIKFLCSFKKQVKPIEVHPEPTYAAIVVESKEVQNGDIEMQKDKVSESSEENEKGK